MAGRTSGIILTKGSCLRQLDELKENPMPRIANKCSVMRWIAQCYPRLHPHDLIKLYGLLSEFTKADPILYRPEMLMWPTTTLWSLPFIFTEEEAHLFTEYEEYTELAEQMMVLESGGRLTLDDFC